METNTRLRILLLTLLFTLAIPSIVASDTHPSSVPGIEVPEGFDAEILAEGLLMPFGMARMADDNLIVGSNCGTCPALKLSPTGAVLASSSMIFDPDGVAVGSDGRVFVTAGYGVTVANSFTAGLDQPLVGGFSNLNDVVVGPSGEIYAYENSGEIWPISPGGVLAPAPLAKTPKGEGMSLDPITNGLLVTSGYPSDGVLAIAPDGTMTPIATMPAFSTPEDAEQGPGGPFGDAIYVTLMNTGEILAVDRATGAWSVFSHGFARPGRLVFEGQEGLLVSDLDAGRIVRIFPLAPPVDPVIEVRFDVTPGCINLNGRGVLPVAIFGSETLDVGAIDFESLSLEGLTVMSPGRSSRLKVQFVFIDDDAHLDALVHFADDGSWTGEGESATLTGMLMDGTAIEGTDSLCMVPTATDPPTRFKTSGRAPRGH